LDKDGKLCILESKMLTGGSNMRQFPRFLIVSATLFFCSIFIPIAQGQEKLQEVVKKTLPSTVIILTYGKDGKIIGQGSGFFVSKDGDIITNRHVLTEVYRAEIKTAKGKIYPILMIVGEDKEADIIRASVDIRSESVHPLSVSISIPEVGERVAVIGSPLGFEQTVSDGIVSAVREIPAFGKIYQITAPISPGSSGSPVVNMKGVVIGVAAFQLVEGQNLNFAIPGERIANLKTEKRRTLAQGEGFRDKAEWKNQCYTQIAEQTAALAARDWPQLERLAKRYLQDCKAAHDSETCSKAYENIATANIQLNNPIAALAASNECIYTFYGNAGCHVKKVEALIYLERLAEAQTEFKIAERLLAHLIKVNERALRKYEPSENGLYSIKGSYLRVQKELLDAIAIHYKLNRQGLTITPADGLQPPMTSALARL
jgi:hypothetical protein